MSNKSKIKTVCVMWEEISLETFAIKNFSDVVRWQFQK